MKSPYEAEVGKVEDDIKMSINELFEKLKKIQYESYLLESTFETGNPNAQERKDIK